ncbi:MAG: hypothetical protein Q7V63_03235 [Gammaproteobacteria bacterium]|nr:hypothetical protein [Gammaproteobacteria bacterium]
MPVKPQDEDPTKAIRPLKPSAPPVTPLSRLTNPTNNNVNYSSLAATPPSRATAPALLGRRISKPWGCIALTAVTASIGAGLYFGIKHDLDPKIPPCSGPMISNIPNSIDFHRSVLPYWNTSIYIPGTCSHMDMDMMVSYVAEAPAGVNCLFVSALGSFPIPKKDSPIHNTTTFDTSAALNSYKNTLSVECEGEPVTIILNTIFTTSGASETHITELRSSSAVLDHPGLRGAFASAALTTLQEVAASSTVEASL